MKLLRLLLQFFIQLPDSIFVCGILERELLEKIVPVKHRFYRSVWIEKW